MKNLPVWHRKLPGAMFALVLGLGYLTALANLFFSTHEADLKPGMSLRDIEVRFHGDPTMTRLKYMVLGDMREHLETEDELNTILEWLDAGAREKTFGPVMEVLDNRCVNCHNPLGKSSFRPLTEYDEVAIVTKPDEGMPWDRLATISHQHFFGMGLLALAMSWILWNQTSIPHRAKTGLVLMGFIGVILDVGGWWLTKLNESFAVVVAGAGGLSGLFYGLAIAIIWWDLLKTARDPMPEA
ncbi:hypothetical protein K8I61_17910 [bacterium]|nr:hypothetical protein [bacterium]